VAHQFIGQLDDKIKKCRLWQRRLHGRLPRRYRGRRIPEKQFTPVFTQTDISNLDNFNAYVRLLSGGRPAKPFNMRIMPPEKGNMEQVDKLKELSSLMFGRPRAEVEEEVMRKYQK